MRSFITVFKTATAATILLTRWQSSMHRLAIIVAFSASPRASAVRPNNETACESCGTPPIRDSHAEGAKPQKNASGCCRVPNALKIAIKLLVDGISVRGIGKNRRQNEAQRENAERKKTVKSFRAHEVGQKLHKSSAPNKQ